jgi:hypothetical protein
MKTSKFFKQMGGLLTAFAVLVACGNESQSIGPDPDFNFIEDGFQLVAPSSSQRACLIAKVELRGPKEFSGANFRDLLEIESTGFTGTDVRILSNSVISRVEGEFVHVEFMAVDMAYDSQYVVRMPSLTTTVGGNTLAIEATEQTFSTAQNEDDINYCDQSLLMVGSQGFSPAPFTDTALTADLFDADGDLNIDSSAWLDLLRNSITPLLQQNLITPKVPNYGGSIQFNLPISSNFISNHISVYQVNGTFTSVLGERLTSYTDSACFTPAGSLRSCVAIEGTSMFFFAPNSTISGTSAQGGDWFSVTDQDADPVNRASFILLLHPSLASVGGFKTNISIVHPFAVGR